MTYIILRQYCHLVLHFLIKTVSIKGLENLPKTGPVLLASNHPNSLIDGILIHCKIKRPTWSLARGDAFKKPWVAKFLKKVHQLPIYRATEGRQNLSKNEDTFSDCNEHFENDGQVLIFSEGLCKNQTTVLPLKKGTARMVKQAWEESIPLSVTPVTLQYESFRTFGKTANLDFAVSITKNAFSNVEEEALFLKSFNDILHGRLSESIDRPVVKKPFYNSWIYYLGWLINFPLYLIIIPIVKAKTKGSVFFDTFCFMLLIILLPFYWLSLVGICTYFF